MHYLALRAVVCVALLVTCAPARAQSTEAARPTAPAGDAADAATGARIKAHVAFLADDLLEGRKAGTPGHEIAARYIAAQFALAGAAPGAAGGSYLHPIELHETARTGTPPQVVLITPGGTRTFMHGEDAFIAGAHDGGTVTIEAPLVFVGYGIHDTRLSLDDYAGLDVRGKIVVALAGAPKGMDSEVAAHLGTQGVPPLRAMARSARSPFPRRPCPGCYRGRWRRRLCATSNPRPGSRRKGGLSASPSMRVRTPSSDRRRPPRCSRERPARSPTSSPRRTRQGDARRASRYRARPGLP